MPSATRTVKTAKKAAEGVKDLLYWLGPYAKNARPIDERSKQRLFAEAKEFVSDLIKSGLVRGEDPMAGGRSQAVMKAYLKENPGYTPVKRVPSSIFTRSDNPVTVEDLVNNYMRGYLMLTPNELARGQSFYPSALETVKYLARHFDVPTENMAAAVSALSPKLGWYRNVLAAYEAARALQMGLQPYARTVGGTKNMAKAMAALRGQGPFSDPIEVFRTGTSPKTLNFYATILGGGYPEKILAARGIQPMPVIDSLMARAALGDPIVEGLGGPSQYAIFSEALEEAARRLGGRHVPTTQAEIWTGMSEGIPPLILRDPSEFPPSIPVPPGAADVLGQRVINLLMQGASR